MLYAPPAVVIFTWTGFYFGAHAGGGWGHTDVNGSPYRATSRGEGVIAPSPVGVDVSGWLAGGQIGANYQAGSWVLGAEADVSGANLTGSTTCKSTLIASGVVLSSPPVVVPANWGLPGAESQIIVFDLRGPIAQRAISFQCLIPAISSCCSTACCRRDVPPMPRTHSAMAVKSPPTFL